jgi:protein-S-isoprenylcysteine O-methyltransferase Ste14
MTLEHPAVAVRGTAWAVAAFYLLIAFEFFYMATPFAAYFYGAYLRGLQAVSSTPQLAGLTSFFLPHYAASSSDLVNSAAAIGGVVTALGLLGFLVGAAQVYSRKLRRRGAAVGGVYRFVRHPQYASLILAGTGMLALWPRFLMVASFVTMLFIYHALAWVEERECLREFGQAYADYQQRTPRFVPFGRTMQRLFSAWWSQRPWLVRVLAGVLAYASALTLALGLASAVQAYSLRHLYTCATGNAVHVSLTPLDGATLRAVAQVAAADDRVRARVDSSTGEGRGSSTTSCRGNGG